MASLRQVDPDLMRTAGFESANELRGRPAELVDPFVMSDRSKSVARVVWDPSTPIASVDDQREFDRAARGLDGPLDYRHVRSFDRMRPKHWLKWSERLGRADEQNHPRCVAVDPVHDADIGPFDSTVPRQMATRALEQRVSLAFGRRLGQHSRRFVDNQDMLVFIQDPQSSRGRFWPGSVGTISQRCVELDFRARLKTWLTLDVDMPAPYSLLGLSPRKAKSLGSPFI
jgi:hypothetical protein